MFAIDLFVTEYDARDAGKRYVWEKHSKLRSKPATLND